MTTYSGSAALEADWAANHVAVTYYNGDSVYGNGGECTYDDTLTLPSAPSKDGYTFDGWRVRRAAAPSGFDLSTWDYGTLPSHNAQNIRWKRFDPSQGYSMQDAYHSEENSSDLNNGEWALTFGNGTVKGVSTCSTIGGNNHDWKWGGNSADWSLASDVLTAGEYSWDNSSDMQYCWCKATSVDTGSGYQTVASSSWVFSDDIDFDEAFYCAYKCAYYCATNIQYSGYYEALFGITQ